jgi:hypothetical protein
VEPTEEEVLEYATYLGMNLDVESRDDDDDHDLLWIAKEGLTADLPENWTVKEVIGTDHIYYYNTATAEISWVHPNDLHYQQLFEQKKSEKLGKERTLTSSF